MGFIASERWWSSWEEGAMRYRLSLGSSVNAASLQQGMGETGKRRQSQREKKCRSQRVLSFEWCSRPVRMPVCGCQ